MPRTQSAFPGQRALRPDEKVFLESAQTIEIFKRTVEHIDLTWKPERLFTSFGPYSIAGKEEFGPVPIRVNPRLTEKDARHHLRSLGIGPEDIEVFISKYFEVQRWVRTEIKGLKALFAGWFPYIAERNFSGYAVEQITQELARQFFPEYQPMEGTIRRRYESYRKRTMRSG